MRILIWTHTYYPVWGGAETVCRQMVRGLKEKGHEVMVITNTWHPVLKSYELPLYENVDNVKVIRLTHFQLQEVKFNLIRCLNYIHKTILRRITEEKIRSYIEEFKPDLINIQYPDSQIGYWKFVKRKFDIPFVVSFHGSDIYNQYYKFTQGKGNGYSKSVKFQYFKNALLSSDFNTFCSEWLSNLAKECIQIKTEKIAVIYNGVEFENYKHKPTIFQESYLFAFGRLSHIKGFDLLVRSFENILFHYPELKLIIAGDGEGKHDILSIIEQLGLRESVFLKGFLNQKDILSYAECASVNVIPSRREAFSLSVLEAISSLRPVVATNVGGIPEAGGDLVHYAEPNVESLTEVIKKALNAPPSDKEKVRAHLANFTVAKMVDKYEGVFKEVCGKD